MQVPPRSLKAILNTTMVWLGLLGLGVGATIVILGTLFHRRTTRVESAIETVRLAEETGTELLLHSRALEPVMRAELADTLRDRIVTARLRASATENGALLRGASTWAALYLAATREGSPRAARRALLDSAYKAIEAVVRFNRQRAEAELAHAARLDRLADYVGVGYGLLLLGGALGFVHWIRSVALGPLFELSDVMERFGHGDRAARITESGAAELRAMARGFNEMAAALAIHQARQLAFIASVAHDLRTPLSTLRVSVCFVAPDQPLPPEPQTRALLQTLARQITRLDRMVGDLLDAARIETGELQLQAEDGDARELVRNVADLFEHVSPRHALQLDLPEHPVFIRWDLVRIEQVLCNLVSNAMKYSPEGGTITLQLEPRREEVVLSVADPGIGIAPEEQAALFEPFRRVGLSREAIPGVGLGLYVVRRIAEAHGGHIHLESVPGRGSIFRVRLPRGTPGLPSAERPG